MKTKKHLVTKFAELISDCGRNDFYGYYLSDGDFIKKMLKLKKREIESTLSNYSLESKLLLN